MMHYLEVELHYADIRVIVFCMCALQCNLEQVITLSNGMFVVERMRLCGKKRGVSPRDRSKRDKQRQRKQ